VNFDFTIIFSFSASSVAVIESDLFEIFFFPEAARR